MEAAFTLLKHAKTLSVSLFTEVICFYEKPEVNFVEVDNFLS